MLEYLAYRLDSRVLYTAELQITIVMKILISVGAPRHANAKSGLTAHKI